MVYQTHALRQRWRNETLLRPDLPRIAEAIQRKCSITPVRFFSLSDQETIDYLFAFVRPSKSLEWSQLFRTCLPYPAYSQVFLNQQTLIMKLDDLAKFVDSTLDLVFVLGDYASSGS